MTRLFIAPACWLLFSTALAAADGRSGLPAFALFDPLADGWKYEGKLALQFSSTSVHNPETSRDPTIAGSAASAAGLETADLRATYVVGPASVEHTLSQRYGRIRDTSSSTFVENDDEIRYDGTLRYLLGAPHFVYALSGFDTVATGPYPPPGTGFDNAHAPFDPFVMRVSAGYGQRYEQSLPDDFLEWRVGVRYQQRWESQPAPGQDSSAVGPELYARYETVPQQFDKKLSFFVQYEAFSLFKDPAHFTNLITASLTFKFSDHLQFQTALRAYYETRPADDDNEQLPGYDEWSFKEDVLVGLSWIF